MFGKANSKAKAERLNQAAEADREAAGHQAEIAKWRKETDDPEAADYMIRQHEADLRGAEREARTYRDIAKRL